MGDRTRELAERLEQSYRGIRNGKKAWGSVVVFEPSPGRCVTYRVTVYPPGTSMEERRAVQLYRQWPQVGALGLSVVFLAVAAVVPVVPLFAALGALYVAGWIATARASSAVRRGSEQIQTSFILYGTTVEAVGDSVLVLRTLNIFDGLDRRLADGDLSPAQFEVHWAAVHDALGQRGRSCKD